MQFISVVASRTSQLVNYSDIADECSISEVTAKKMAVAFSHIRTRLSYKTLFREC